MKTAKEAMAKIQLAVITNKPKPADRGFKMVIGSARPVFYNNPTELLNALQLVDDRKVYKIDVKIDDYMFFGIGVTVETLRPEEINKPFKCIAIARNINAFDENYQYIDGSKWAFWNDLQNRLKSLINTCNEKEIQIVKKLASPDKLQIFIK